jgi:hypothetical protein
MNRIFTISYLLFTLSINVFAGIKLPLRLEWETQPVKIQTGPNEYKNILRLNNGGNPSKYGYMPVYSHQINLNSEGELSFSIQHAVFEPLHHAHNYSIYQDMLSSAIEIKYEIHYFRKQPVATLYFIPLVKNNSGGIDKLISAEIEIFVSAKAAKRSSSTRVYAPNSVLASGNWFKFGVSENSIYKLDYNFINSLGLNPANIDPRNIRIYGNGGGMLPEENAAFRFDDLQENAIIVVGENDGRFDQGDYILFFAKGPNQWVYDPLTQRFQHITHVYSDKYYYFITADLGPGKRVTSLPSFSNPNITVTTFDDYARHEKDEYNFLASGREWFGDLFNFSINSRDFSFSFPNIDNSTPAYLRAALVARSIYAPSTFTIYANGQQIVSKNISTVTVNYTDSYAVQEIVSAVFQTGSAVNLNVAFSSPSSSAEGYINYIELNVRRNLVMTGDQLQFRDRWSVGPGNISLFELKNVNSNIIIWDVTHPTEARSVSYTLNGNTAAFVMPTDSLREFVAFYENGNFPSPVAAGKVANQNLHATGQPEMVIVTNNELFSIANALAAYHIQKNNVRSVKVVKTEEIYNEFSSGTQDITAIRDFMRMLYDRAGNDPGLMPQYLLLFGAASYDYKNRIPNNHNFVPTYESPASLNPIASFCTDDYFGCLDVNEGGSMTDNNDLLDVAIGRLPVRNVAEAQAMLNKIQVYQSQASLGSWRNELCYIADDEDNNLHLIDAEKLTGYVESNYPVYNISKIYLDAYTQVSIPGGNRYPDVNDDINRKIFSGALMINYIGHGGVNGWAHERILNAIDVTSWRNIHKLPLFVTATCEFSKYDDPGVYSVGEQVLLSPNGGAIALVTTVRLVFASANYTLNRSFHENLFVPHGNRMPTISEVMMKAKNDILFTSDNANLRKFVLLGDPAVKLNYPANVAVTASVTGTRSEIIDTMRALSKITIMGEVRDPYGNRISNFNGIVYPTVFDKSSTIQTLKNDPSSYVTNFSLQKNIIYRGKASVTNGSFTFSFVVPKDISYHYGFGKISLYADNGQIDAHGYNNTVIVGGTADSFALDNQGPLIKIYMNDEKFAFGGITDETPLLLVKLEDENGINTVGNGIGHDITGVLNRNTQNTYVLNEYYQAELDNYKKGEVRYPMSRLPEGRHSIKVKAWDVYNNSSEEYTEFIVSTSAQLALTHVLNYPNPFTTSTRFMFEHNKPGQPLFVQIKIFTVSGKLIKTIQRNIVSESYRIDDIHWDGRDDFGDPIGKGAYIYKLDVRTEDGSSAHKFEKLVILK